MILNKIEEKNPAIRKLPYIMLGNGDQLYVHACMAIDDRREDNDLFCFA